MKKNKKVSITLFMVTAFLTLAKDASCVSLLPHVDYSSAGMAQYMPEAHKTQENIAFADEILARKYESERRSVSGEYGFSFCLEPEIFDYLQRNSNDKTILELGAAEGDVSALLALGNARKVYVNDILPEEIEKFETTKAQLPAYAQEKLTSSCCDYMKILDKAPELRGSCDFVLFRNGFHFLRDADYPAFFALLRSVLKPDGQIVMNALALQPYIFQQLYPAFLGKSVNEHPTRFKEITVSICNANTTETKPLFKHAYVEDNDHASLVTAPEPKAFMTRTATKKWQIVESGMRTMPAEAIAMFNAYKNDPDFKGVLSGIKNGGIVYATKTSRYFSLGNLFNAFDQAGFGTLALYVSNIKGHLVPNDNDWIEHRDFVRAVNDVRKAIARVGIIATISS